MSATGELRRLLDERGVEHTDAEDGHTQHTWWSDGDHEIAACNSGKRLAVYNLTPEQAIAATLGAGTCELVNAADDLGKGTSSCMCSECGYTALDDWWDEFKYCPLCGAKVVDE